MLMTRDEQTIVG